MPACGILQVTNTARFRQERRSWAVTVAAIEQVERAYLPAEPAWEGEFDLADPLSMLESNRPLHRPLPSFFVPCGTLDPLLNDTRRLEVALRRRGASYEARYYAGELHAFQAMVWRPKARACWRHTFDFLGRAFEEQQVEPAIAA